MRRLSAELSTAGWLTNEMNNWRDCGWSNLCSRGAGQLQIALSHIHNEEWMIQVVPHRVPGFFGGLVGGKPSATPAEFMSWRFPFIGRFRSLVFSVARGGDGTDFLTMSIRQQKQTPSNVRLEVEFRTHSPSSPAWSAQPRR